MPITDRSPSEFTKNCKKRCKNEDSSRYPGGTGFEKYIIGVTGLAMLAFVALCSSVVHASSPAGISRMRKGADLDWPAFELALAGYAQEAHHSRVSEIGILIVIVPDHLDQRQKRFAIGEFSQTDRGEKSNSRTGIG